MKIMRMDQATRTEKMTTKMTKMRAEPKRMRGVSLRKQIYMQQRARP